MIPLFLLIIAGGTPSLAANDFYNCVPGMTDSPGVSLPRGDIKVEAGSEPFPIYCHLNPNHKYFKVDGLNSSDLGFYINNVALQSEIMNQTTIQALFNPENASVTHISCKVRPKHDKNADQDPPSPMGLCVQNVFAGWMPQPPTNFSCVSENWESLNCTWDEPYNPIRTAYSVHFKFPGRFSPFYRCPNKTRVEAIIGKKLPRDLNSCYLDLKTEPLYRQPVNRFDFYVNATNYLKEVGTIKAFIVDHFAVVRPGPAINVQLNSSSPSNIELSYDISNTMHHFEPGVYQAVRFKNDHNSEWKYITTTHLDITLEQFTIQLKDLAFAWTNYTVEVKMISGVEKLEDLDPFDLYHINSTKVCKVEAKTFSESKPVKTVQTCIQDGPLWSDSVTVSGKTESSIPPHAPKTAPGSFEVVGGLEERSVLIYWQKLPPTIYNGPGFGYDVTEVIEDGRVVPIVPNHIANAYAKFDRLNLINYTFFITSKNDIGDAPDTSSVFVAGSDLLKNIMPKSFTKIDMSGRKFEVAWRPPKHAHLVTSYTVYWCRAEDNRDRPYQCDGKLEWKKVEIEASNDKNETFISSVTLPTDDIYQMAVSAETKEFSSGMVWATCTIIQNRVVSKLKNVKVFDVQTNTAHISWQLDCSDRVGIVIGYQVEYCPVASRDEKEKCLASKQTFNITGEAVNAKIENLTPWTWYKFGVRVKTRGGMGEISDPSINQTKSSRPGSPPRKLVIPDIKANSAELSWEPPIKPNGPINNYEVAYWYLNSNGVKFSKKVDVQNQTIELRDLFSYTEYNVSVRACSILSNKRKECGDEWVSTPLVTPIGPPGQMNQPKVVFKNTSIVQVTWNDKFQVGAPTVLEWELRVARNGTTLDWSKTYPPNVTRVELNLDSMHKDQNWSPDCLNNSNTNIFNFSVRAKVENDKKHVFVGPYSEDLQVPAYCAPAYPFMLIILAAVFLPLFVVAAVILLCRLGNWVQRKRAFFDKLSRDLDMSGQEFVIAAHPKIEKGTTQGFNNMYAGKKTEEKKVAYNRGGSRDSMETLLMGKEADKQHHTSESSQNTSSPSSESGDGGERRRTDSENTSGSVEEKEMDTTATSDDTAVDMDVDKTKAPPFPNYVRGGPTGLGNSYVKRHNAPVQNYSKGDVPGMVIPDISNEESSSIEMSDYPDPSLPPTHPLKGATSGYVSMQPRDSADHYSRFSPSAESKLSPSSSPPLPCPGYSRVGSLLDPIGLNDLRQRVVKPPVRGVMAGEDILSNKNDVGPPGTGYVAFNAIKTSPPQPKATSPGYVTIDQLNWN